MKMWWGSRLGRGDLIFAVLALNILYLVGLYVVLDGVSLDLRIGTRSILAIWGIEAVTLTLLKLAFDILLISLCYRRLQDAAYPGWYVFIWGLALWAMSLVPGLAGLASLAGFAGLVAIFFLRPTIGPNRFGPDPRGWKSEAQFKEQQERLKSGDQ